MKVLIAICSLFAACALASDQFSVYSNQVPEVRGVGSVNGRSVGGQVYQNQNQNLHRGSSVGGQGFNQNRGIHRGNLVGGRSVNNIGRQGYSNQGSVVHGSGSAGQGYQNGGSNTFNSGNAHLLNQGARSLGNGYNSQGIDTKQTGNFRSGAHSGGVVGNNGYNGNVGSGNGFQGTFRPVQGINHVSGQNKFVGGVARNNLGRSHAISNKGGLNSNGYSNGNTGGRIVSGSSNIGAQGLYSGTGVRPVGNVGSVHNDNGVSGKRGFVNQVSNNGYQNNGVSNVHGNNNGIADVHGQSDGHFNGHDGFSDFNRGIGNSHSIGNSNLGNGYSGNTNRLSTVHRNNVGNVGINRKGGIIGSNTNQGYNGNGGISNVHNVGNRRRLGSGNGYNNNGIVHNGISNFPSNNGIVGTNNRNRGIHNVGNQRNLGSNTGYSTNNGVSGNGGKSNKFSASHGTNGINDFNGKGLNGFNSIGNQGSFTSRNNGISTIHDNNNNFGDFHSTGNGFSGAKNNGLGSITNNINQGFGSNVHNNDIHSINNNNIGNNVVHAGNSNNGYRANNGISNGRSIRRNPLTQGSYRTNNGYSGNNGISGVHGNNNVVRPHASNNQINNNGYSGNGQIIGNRGIVNSNRGYGNNVGSGTHGIVNQGVVGSNNGYRNSRSSNNNLGNQVSYGNGGQLHRGNGISVINNNVNSNRGLVNNAAYSGRRGNVGGINTVVGGRGKNGYNNQISGGDYVGNNGYNGGNGVGNVHNNINGVHRNLNPNNFNRNNNVRFQGNNNNVGYSNRRAAVPIVKSGTGNFNRNIHRGQPNSGRGSSSLNKNCFRNVDLGKDFDFSDKAEGFPRESIVRELQGRPHLRTKMGIESAFVTQDFNVLQGFGSTGTAKHIRKRRSADFGFGSSADFFGGVSVFDPADRKKTNVQSRQLAQLRGMVKPNAEVCPARRRPLRSLKMNGKRCFTVNRKDRPTMFATCSRRECPECSRGRGVGKCVEEFEEQTMWLWCDDDSFSNNIREVTLLVPAHCGGKSYTC